MPTVRALAHGMRLPVGEYACTGVCYGTFTGWVHNRTDGLAVTVGFGRRVAWRSASLPQRSSRWAHSWRCEPTERLVIWLEPVLTLSRRS